MLNLNYLIKHKDLFPQVLGISYYHFKKLLPKFSQALRVKEYYRIPPEKRKRKIGGGRKSKLGDDAGKLFFILFYYRHYPTIRLAQVIFQLEDSNICSWVHFLSSVLFSALGYQLHLPKVRVNSIRGLYEVCPDLRYFIVDGTERRIKRPKDNNKQKLFYSGKSKHHAVKNQIFLNPKNKKISYITKTIPASVHDKRAFVEDDILIKIPPNSKGLGDLGYQGITKKTLWFKIITPIKRKPKLTLSKTEKQTNKALSSIRVKIEHVIGKLKTFKIAKDTFRGNLMLCDLVFKNICCLYNFQLSYKYSYQYVKTRK